MRHDLKFNVYEDARKEWRWTYVAGNGRKIADSGEGYKNHSDCIAAIDIIKRTAASAAIHDPNALARLLGSGGILGAASGLR